MYFYEYLRELARASNEEVKPNVNKKIRLNNEIEIRNTDYIFNQTLRQIFVDDKHFHISEKALKELSVLKIEKSKLFEYVFNANLSYKNKDNQSVRFNSSFIVEHIVPINTIMKEMKNAEKDHKLTDRKILEILDEIHICIITKKEDEELNQKKYRKNRSGHYKDVIGKNGAYGHCGIKVIEKIPFDKNGYLKNH